jgi:hypothetical protein
MLEKCLDDFANALYQFSHIFAGGLIFLLMVTDVSQIPQPLNEPPSREIHNICFLYDIVQLTNGRVLGMRKLMLIANRH